jgi:hypothetical protein
MRENLNLLSQQAGLAVVIIFLILVTKYLKYEYINRPDLT